MNLGLLLRAWRETLWTSLVFAGVLGAVSAIFAYALPRVQARFMQRSFVPPAVREFRDALFGFDSAGAGVSEVAFSIAWSHPVILALLSAHAIVVCTRLPAGEIERGTADVLFALPVSRLKLYASETAAWLGVALLVLGAIPLGSYVGSRFIDPAYRPDWSRLGVVFVNLAFVYAAIGCGSLLAATLTDRRTRAVLAVVIATVFSILINFLYTLDPALAFTKKLAFLSVLDYYRPIRTLMDGTWPVRDLAILGGVVAGFWALAAAHFVRRDLTTT
ncbi:MAG: ABC transporter permease subunit [Phycisphaeraceae bacterium]|nr:MAG: ABC transporter permease subunit [Phycisphaeraceae bacterium]